MGSKRDRGGSYAEDRDLGINYNDFKERLYFYAAPYVPTAANLPPARALIYV